jgi:hypothetical protein
MKKLSTHLGIALVLAAGMSAAAFADDRPSQCSLRTLRGRYVFSASGFQVDAAAGAIPKALIEVIDFNGDGTLAVPAATRSLNGVATRSLPSVGTYTVNADCTGTITFAGPTFDIFLSPRGNQFWLIQTNLSSVFQGSATRTMRDLPGPDTH